MSSERIQKLEEQLANQIAAGEVVERPGAALKELVENSLDAGAKSVRVRIAHGGSTLIEVADDGSGIHADDLLLALDRHATSKIRTTEDLFAIRTWGFRGEALASIAAVSRLTISSRKRGAAEGREIIVEGGEVLSNQVIARPEGTTVRVENLFFNTPARKKFLKSQGAESSQCIQTLHRLALGTPEVSFDLEVDETKSFHYSAQETYPARISQVFHESWRVDVDEDDLISVHEKRENAELRAWILPSKHFIPSSRGILTFVNGRVVKDKLLQQSILAAAKEVLFGQLYPQLVLYLTLPPDWVDVNVHPTKAEVRFKEPGYVFAFVRKHVEAALARDRQSSFSTGATPDLGTGSAAAYAGESFAPAPELFSAGVQFHQKLGPGVGFAHGVAESVAAAVEPRFAPQPPTVQFLGTLKNTYLVCQDSSGLVLVDQHAAHERVTYEKLKAAKLREIRAQPLLIPLQVEIPQQVLDKIEGDFDKLQSLGLTLDRTGPTMVSVRELPSLLIRADGSPVISVGRFLRELAPLWEEDASDTDPAEKLKEKILDVLASESCHGSVRAGQNLAPSEALALLAQMSDTDFSGHCPHGRPTTVRLSWNEIERLFKRVF